MEINFNLYNIKKSFINKKQKNTIGVVSIIIAIISFSLVGIKIIKTHNNNNFKKADSSIYIDDHKIHIVIDAGHGGPDVGAINKKHHTYEKNIARQMVDAVVAMADTSKYTILQTRPLDSNIHRHNRIEWAKKFRTELLLSFHCNSHTNKSWNGTEIHISDSTVNVYDSSSKLNPYLTQNIKIATALSTNISSVFPLLKKNGVVHRKDRIWIIYAGTFPSAIIEWGYLSNSNDIKIMQDPVAHQLLATTVWKCIDEYFGMNK